MSWWARTLTFLGAGAKTIGRGAKTIDPDVVRHVAQLPLMAPSLLVPRQAPVRYKRDDGHPPVVFVHGLGGQRGDFFYLGAYLSMRGRRRRYALQFQRASTIEERAKQLVDYVAEVRMVTNATEVDLVAHSLGGVVARLALHEVDFARSVRTVVTLGAPHGGTHSARLANTVLTRSLRPGSPVMSRLRPPPDGVRAVSLWSRGDLIVLPPQSAMWDGAEHIEVSPFTHYSYLIEPRGWRTVGRVLEGQPTHEAAAAHG